jgi:hypothetical protein
MDVYSIITERIIEKLEAGTHTVAPAMAQYRRAAQSCLQKVISRRKCLAAYGAGLHLALLGNHAADQ